jgi:hypothetical protein
MKFIQIIIVLTILINGTLSQAQDRVVSGTVTDRAGNYLPGVNIIVKGTPSGTVTDANGEFSITVKSNVILVVSFAGYSSTEIDVGSKSSVKIVLDDDVTPLKYWCCTDHVAPDGPHCDADKEILKKEFKCKNFERQ